MTHTMVKGTILVKATKIQIENSNDYYFEFNLNEGQVSGLVAELCLAHVKNNSLTVIHQNEGNIPEKERAALFLKTVLETHGETMSPETKCKYLDTILDLSIS
jgi:hypothetical protein